MQRYVRCDQSWKKMQGDCGDIQWDKVQKCTNTAQPLQLKCKIYQAEILQNGERIVLKFKNIDNIRYI